MCILGSVAAKTAHAGAFTATALDAFCSQPNCADGAAPRYTPTMDSNGNLYGTTVLGGGASQKGVVFELRPRAGAYRYSVLYRFCPKRDVPTVPRQAAT